jgi:hypothetical protein
MAEGFRPVAKDDLDNMPRPFSSSDATCAFFRER